MFHAVVIGQHLRIAEADAAEHALAVKQAYPCLGAVANVQGYLGLVAAVAYEEGERGTVSQGCALAGNRQSAAFITCAFHFIRAGIEEAPLHAESIRRKIVRQRNA